MHLPSDRPVVLIVDDNEDTGDMYAASLSQAGFETRVARDGFDGLKIACETTPDAVVTDVLLHGPMDGLTLTRRLRFDERTRRTPIIVLTGRVSERDRDEANRAGCDLFLTKPCLPEELAAEVHRILLRREDVYSTRSERGSARVLDAGLHRPSGRSRI